MKLLHYIPNLRDTDIETHLLLSKFPDHIKILLLEENNYPIIESYDDFEVFVMLLPIYNPEYQQITLIECDLIIGQKEIFFITSQEIESISHIVESLHINKKTWPTRYKLLLEIGNYILKHIITLEKIIESLKQSTINDNEYTKTTINDIMKLKLTIGMFKSTIDPLIDIMNHIFETIEYPEIQTQDSNRNQIDYLIKQIKSQSNFLYENISIVADTANAIQNINANIIMKTLTIISSIFIPLSFITGVFGMNFVDLPVSNTLFYYSVIAIMIFIWSFQLYAFKQRKRL